MPLIKPPDQLMQLLELKLKDVEQTLEHLQLKAHVYQQLRDAAEEFIRWYPKERWGMRFQSIIDQLEELESDAVFFED